jgi:radical SAM protein with 4Fe4S-binding SPASM domain
MAKVVRKRGEHFGGILQTEDPPALLYVDREYMRELGHAEDPLWKGTDPQRLTAPTEVHLTVTRRCDAACRGCYTDSSQKRVEEDLDTAYWKGVIGTLAEMGVFHMAMGGGESTLREDLFELAAYARGLGIMPNLTTNGLKLTPEMAERCRIFGQINISIDGVDEVYKAVRGFDGFPDADRGMRMLLDAGIQPGINCVVARQNIDHLEAVVQYAERLGLSEVEFLRYKPTGRGALQYASQRVPPERHQRFMHDLKLWMDRYRTPLKIDCSFVPFLCDLNPDPALLDRFGVHGCEAGNVLAAVQPEGTFSACSFVDEPAGKGEDIGREWNTNAQLESFRRFPDRPPAPCDTCAYLATCRGGCSVVSQHVSGDRFAPDPECPRVVRLQGGCRTADGGRR